MLAEVLVTAGAVALAVLATLQWCLSGQGLKPGHASQALDLFADHVLSAELNTLEQRVLSSATSTSQTSSTFIAMGKTSNLSRGGGQGERISRRRMAIRYNCKKLSFNWPY